MSNYYANGKPIGKNGVPFYDSPPPYVALDTDVRDSATASSILVLTDDTTAIEVGATGAPAYVKWLAQSVVDSSVAGTSVISAAGTANFDHMIPDGMVRRLVVPIARINTAEGSGSVVGANIANGLYKNVAIIGAASVATTQHGL